MALNSYFSQGTQAERDLYEDLVIEQIKIYGQDLKYMPRTLVNRDELFGEDVSSKFDDAYTLEMYIANVEGFEGDGDLYSKFGIRVTDQATFVVSRKRWTEEVDDNAELIREGRPNEGDLIYFPLTKKLFEIKFVEYKKPFYQLKNPYGAFVYELRCELFEYSDEVLDTGDAEIDNIETTFAAAIKLIMDPGGTGDFQVGEEVVGDEYHAKATATITGDAVTAVTITDGGSNYNAALPPSVTFSGGGGNGATGTATVSAAGVVTGVTITSGGTGYTSAPDVHLDYSPKDNRAEVKSWNSSTRELQVINRTGVFTTAETVTGLTSNAKWSPESYNTINNTNSAWDQNDYIETEADDIIDWTETNPFGDFGNQGDSY